MCVCSVDEGFEGVIVDVFLSFHLWAFVSEFECLCLYPGIFKDRHLTGVENG